MSIWEGVESVQCSRCSWNTGRVDSVPISTCVLSQRWTCGLFCTWLVFFLIIMGDEKAPVDLIWSDLKVCVCGLTVSGCINFTFFPFPVLCSSSSRSSRAHPIKNQSTNLKKKKEQFAVKCLDVLRALCHWKPTRSAHPSLSLSLVRALDGQCPLSLQDFWVTSQSTHSALCRECNASGCTLMHQFVHYLVHFNNKKGCIWYSALLSFFSLSLSRGELQWVWTEAVRRIMTRVYFQIHVSSLLWTWSDTAALAPYLGD